MGRQSKGTVQRVESKASSVVCSTSADLIRTTRPRDWRSTMDEQLAALEASIDRLQMLVGGLDSAALVASAYPSEWTIADVLSHVGSGAVIMGKGIECTVSGTEMPTDFANGVWDVWNAKSPEEQAADVLIADRSYLERVYALTDAERADFKFAMAGQEWNIAEFLVLRLTEHSFHTWDVEVVSDPAATVPVQSAQFVVDNLEMATRYSAKPDGNVGEISVITRNPDRAFVIKRDAESVTLVPDADVESADLELDAESFARLVYGRLDADHTPPSVTGPADIDALREMFPGV